MKCLYMLFVFEIKLSDKVFQTSITCTAEKHEQHQQKKATGARIFEWGVRHSAPAQVSSSGKCSSGGKGQVQVSVGLSVGFSLGLAKFL